MGGRWGGAEWLKCKQHRYICIHPEIFNIHVESDCSKHLQFKLKVTSPSDMTVKFEVSCQRLMHDQRVLLYFFDLSGTSYTATCLYYGTVLAWGCTLHFVGNNVWYPRLTKEIHLWVCRRIIMYPVKCR